jgi:regulator of sigma D
MSAAVEFETERRQESRSLIEELQQERREVWSLYCRIAELKPFSSAEKVQEILTEFSQMLVDYVSLGHFGIFQRVIDGNERREAVLTAAQEIYPGFVETTDAAVLFNDKYDKKNSADFTKDLEQDLSSLGEKLAKRIDLEDKLCSLISG